ncbi:hypothetical protein HJB80_02650 [Rhizobium lentis]|uniref:hypothetical protein n=1 Tax=Rhizobium lentis TaxID=1138194 RepID=UPI001C82B208|nr:hypothetical protein [Rhizobium lentis]MBX5131593.1 hypothetical protein [Rhizobium lentis]
MTDIIDRLRKVEYTVSKDGWNSRSLAGEAADEIASQRYLVNKLLEQETMHNDGQSRHLRIIARLTQLCDESGLGEKARAVVSEESRK